MSAPSGATNRRQSSPVCAACTDSAAASAASAICRPSFCGTTSRWAASTGGSSCRTSAGCGRTTSNFTSASPAGGTRTTPRNLAKARDHGRGAGRSLFGFSDLYVPLVSARTFTLVFFCGQWAKELPTRETILTVWRELSGHEPVVDDVIFRQWARCCLAVPVLAGPVQDGLIELGGLLGQLFSDHTEAVERRIERLRERVFLPTIHDESWVSSCLDVTGLTRPPWGLDEFMDERIVEETQLRHRPSQLAILMPKLSERDGLDQLDRWIGQTTVPASRRPSWPVRCPIASRRRWGITPSWSRFAAAPSLRGRARQSHFESRCRLLQQTLRTTNRVRVSRRLGRRGRARTRSRSMLSTGGDGAGTRGPRRKDAGLGGGQARRRPAIRRPTCIAPASASSAPSSWDAPKTRASSCCTTRARCWPQRAPSAGHGGSFSAAAARRPVVPGSARRACSPRAGAPCTAS